MLGKGYVLCQEGGACAAMKSLTLSKNRQNTQGLAGQPCFTPMLTSKAAEKAPPPLNH